MKTFLIIITNVLLIINTSSTFPLDDDAIAFRDDQGSPKQDHIQPPQLPVIDHLENDPSTIFRTDIQQLPSVDRFESPLTPPKNPAFQGGQTGQQQLPINPPNNPQFQGGQQQQPQFQGPPNNPESSLQDGTAELDNRFGIPGLFDLGRNDKGEFTASFSANRPNLLGGKTSAAHSVALGADLHKGITLSHTGTRTSSTGGLAQMLLGLSGSRTNSLSSSLNAGLGGIGAAHSGSSAGSIAGNFFGKNFAKSGSNSRSGAAGIGQKGIGAALGISNGYSDSYDGKTNSGANSFTQTFGQGAQVNANGQGNAFNVNGQKGASSQAGSNAGIDLGNGFVNAGTNAGSFQVQGSDIAFRFPEEDEGRPSYYNPNPNPNPNPYNPYQRQQFRRPPPRWQQYDVPTAGSSGYRILKFEI